MELSNYFNEKMNDALRYVAPDSVDQLLNQSDKMNRENAEALQNASSAVTNEDAFIDKRAKQLGQEIPLTEDLANKIMYFPEAIPNAVDSTIRGDFKDDDGSYSDRVGKIIGGLNPAGDVRDIVADGRRVVDGEKGSWIKFGATVIGAVPIAGDGAKALIKAEEKAIIEALENTGKKAIVEETTEGLIKTESKKVGEETVEKFVAEDANKVLTETTGRTTIKETSEKVALTASGDKALTQDTLKHIFHGEINKSNKAVGFHYEGVENMQAVNKTRTVTITKTPDKNGVYVAKVEVNGVAKKGVSSFFPKTWTKNDVVNAVNEAYINKIPTGKPNQFEGISSSGVKIQMYLKPDGTISTPYPLHGK